MSDLSQYFTGIIVKRLSAVETDTRTSNQHEFNGIKEMCNLFGTEKAVISTVWIYLGNDEDETLNSEGTLTWYDARKNHATRTEYRLYFQTNSISDIAKEGDLLVIAQKPDGNALSIVVKQDSTFERQVLWLFGIEGEANKFSVNRIEGDINKSIGFAERTILESIGVEVEQANESLLDMLLGHFGESFPTTAIFSEFARNTIPDVNSVDDPDKAVLAWINQEEMLFRTLEKHIVEKRLRQGFDDVDVFVKFSLSVHNRRKSRVGYALENHIQTVFEQHKVSYSRGKKTENKAKPDFIFPTIEDYHNDDFPIDKLTMLGSKSTCKDRWRQVLSEANKIKDKHLFTLEPSISLNQTTEMQAKHLQLVLPQEIHESYLAEQQAWLMNFNSFIDLVKHRPS